MSTILGRTVTVKNLLSLTGTSGDDSMVGGTNADDTVSGGLGSDFIVGDVGNDTIFGGRAIADGEDSADTIYGDMDGDSISSSSDHRADKIYGNAGNDSLYGGFGPFNSADSGNDTIWGGLGNDSVFGQDGDDVLCGGGGLRHPNDNADYLEGGTGNDVLIGNGGNDTLQGNEGADTFEGGIGDDMMDGGDGNDIILTRSGNDTLTGGNGADTFVFGKFAGAVVIYDFNVADGDRIVGIDNTGTTPAEVMEIAQSMGGNLIFDFGGGHSLTINNAFNVTESVISIVSTDSAYTQPLIDLNV